MQAALKGEFVTVDEYLAGEQTTEVRHEYIAGAVYAMAGASKEHNQIAQNIAFAARSHLRGRPCSVFISDVKVRLTVLGDDVFYYPDVMVGCDPRDTHRLYLNYPRILVEVTSDSTERLDRREKLWAYQTIDTLEEYLLVTQDRTQATLFRRASLWQPESFNRLDHVLSLDSIGLKLPLSVVYEAVTY